MGLLRRRHKLRIGLWEAPERDECFFDIVGESFHADEIRKLIDAAGPLVKQYGEWRKLGVQFYLVPEPENPHDSNAIAVWTGSEESFSRRTAIKVGHIDRETASIWAARIKTPTTIEGVIVGKQDNFGVKLDLNHLIAAGLLNEA